MTDWVEEQHRRIHKDPDEAETAEKGGPGSGHHGHAGRPGKRGGSQPGKGGGGGSSSGGQPKPRMDRDEAGTYMRLKRKAPDALTILDHPGYGEVEFRWRGGGYKRLPYHEASSVVHRLDKRKGGARMSAAEARQYLELDSRFPHSAVRIHSWDTPGHTDIEVIGEPGGKRRMKNIDAAKLIARLSGYD